MNRRLYERTNIESNVVIIRSTGNIHCKSINLSEGGACFMIDKGLAPDISDWKRGMELKFEFESDRNKDEGDGIVPVYTCFVMHVDDEGDSYRVGVDVSEDVDL